MDFFKVVATATKKGETEVYPVWRCEASRDLLTRGKAFYAVWDAKRHIWTRDELSVARMVDDEVAEVASRISNSSSGLDDVIPRYMSEWSPKGNPLWRDFQNYLRSIPDNYVQLDNTVTFAGQEVKREDYVSHSVPYPLKRGDHPAYDELMHTNYDPEERRKLEWAIGSIVAGDSKDIQKFIVIYGEPGTGKSTVLHIIEKLFPGYITVFDAKGLGTSSNLFATEAFRGNPLVAIQHDGDLSRIEDNTRLNSIVSHENMEIHEKYKSSYMARLNCFLFMATNKPVKITDARSGIIRRLIDVRPSGRTLDSKTYFRDMDRIDFELGAIAQHCLDVYSEMGPNYYADYKPLEMMQSTDPFYNFIEDNYFQFKDDDGVAAKRAYDMYKTYCAENHLQYVMPYYRFRDELKDYFREWPKRGTDGSERHIMPDGTRVRNWYGGFRKEKFNVVDLRNVDNEDQMLELNCEESLFDDICAECPAQYANIQETPSKRWDDVSTTLADIDTRKIHYVRVPENHIVIDFDLKDADGNKSAELNLKAAAKWPATYAEFSKGGQGVHLHYIWSGSDVAELSRVYEPGIEVKVFTGKSSLRRRLTRCNDIPIATLSSGLPLKGGAKMLNERTLKTEQGLRRLIQRNLEKDIHPGTKPSVDFIKKILDDAYDQGLVYDVSDMRSDILSFAMHSSHHADYCVKTVGQMKFMSEKDGSDEASSLEYKDDALYFFDVEIFPNLFVVCWKREGDSSCVSMVNPTADQIGMLIEHKLVGFNCRKYDNHILYAAYIGYNVEQLYDLSNQIVNGSNRNGVYFREAYSLSYTDVYDFSSKKQSLKKFEIDLGIHHQELGLPWDQPVPESMWDQVVEYCNYDVIATEETFKARKADWTARQILADISGLTVNDTTNQHTTRIIFGNEKHPQSKFVYTDLSEMFPGYKYENGKSSYRGEDPGEGGYVYAEPGMYENVALLDIASMHPTSIENLNLFGPYTKRFSAIKSARICIKHGDFESAGKLFDGKLKPYLTDKETATALAYALKIAINSVYGLTSASFDNPFKDPRNVDNIVAKRGALFMIDLKHAVQELGYTVAHIKTDSIKVPNADQKIIDFVTEFGKKYGYDFEHEATYDRMCLVNNAVYIARYGTGSHAGQWTATGAQFAQPYVFKTLFSNEPIGFSDLCETRNVATALYLDMNECLPEDEHNYVFVGKTGQFCPIKKGSGGGVLLRSNKDGKGYSNVTNSKGFRWLESETVMNAGLEAQIDRSYFDELVNDALENMGQYGDVEWFISDDSERS